MKDDYLDIVDEVVMKAFRNGCCIPKKEVWDIYAVKYRLNTYGEVSNDGRYYLNERGMEYVLSGCSDGIRDKIKRQEEIERLDIQTKSFTERKQSKTYWMSVISFWISILAFFGGYEVLLDLLSWLSNLVESLCSS